MEQSEFGIELETLPIQRPVSLPREALDALSKDGRVVSCLENEGLSPNALPANWFVASEIHLDGKNEADLVVLPDDRPPDTKAGKITSVACFLGANTAQMWVLRGTQPGFKLVLSQIGLPLDVVGELLSEKQALGSQCRAGAKAKKEELRRILIRPKSTDRR